MVWGGSIFDNVTSSETSSSTSAKITNKNDFSIYTLIYYSAGSGNTIERKYVSANDFISLTSWVKPDILAVMKAE